jgi:hypothetical protein
MLLPHHEKPLDIQAVVTFLAVHGGGDSLRSIDTADRESRRCVSLSGNEMVGNGRG